MIHSPVLDKSLDLKSPGRKRRQPGLLLVFVVFFGTSRAFESLDSMDDARAFAYLLGMMLFVAGLYQKVRKDWGDRVKF